MKTKNLSDEKECKIHNEEITIARLISLNFVLRECARDAG